MSIAARLNTEISRCNVLAKPAQQVTRYFEHHPTAFKAALVFNHFFRAAAMAGFMAFLPLSYPLSFGICAASSLFYRVTVEPNCAYKFALPAFAGAISAMHGKAAVLSLIKGAAFASMNAFAATLTTLLPLSAYITYVILTVSHDVDSRRCSSCKRN